MKLWHFVVVMFCVLSAGDLVKAVQSNPVWRLRLRGSVNVLFMLLTLPAIVGVFALPIYGFITMPWWHPLVGIVAAALLTSFITRPVLAESGLLPLAAMGFSLAGLALFAVFRSGSIG